MKPEETGKAYDSITDRWAEDRFIMNNGIRQHQLALKFANGKGAAAREGSFHYCLHKDTARKA